MEWARKQPLAFCDSLKSVRIVAALLRTVRPGRSKARDPHFFSPFAEHGRIAMFAFVGYIVQSNFVFPWPQTLAGAPHPSADLAPEAQWDAVPVGAKWQIFAVISALELWDECGGGTWENMCSLYAIHLTSGDLTIPQSTFFPPCNRLSSPLHEGSQTWTIP